MSKNHGRLSRRQFFELTGMLAGAASVSGITTPAEAQETSQTNMAVSYRQLGKTDLKLSVVSMGTGSAQDPKVIQYAIKRGINFFHTANSYAGGRAIKNVAKAIKGQRDKVVIGLKIDWDPDNDDMLDTVLGILGIEYADIAFFNIHKADKVKDKKYRKAAERWKKSKKINYIALTSHGQTERCLKIALDQGFYDALMPSYNLTMSGSFPAIFEQAEKQGIGVVLMKTKKSLDNAAYDKAVAKYLSIPAITTINRTLNSFDAVDDMLARAEKKLSARELDDLERIVHVAAAGSCMMCGSCTDACPSGLAVSDIVRCSEYYLADSEYHGMAQEVYNSLPDSRQASNCGSCGTCESVCPNNVPVRHHIRKAAAALA